MMRILFDYLDLFILIDVYYIYRLYIKNKNIDYLFNIRMINRNYYLFII